MDRDSRRQPGAPRDRPRSRAAPPRERAILRSILRLFVAVLFVAAVLFAAVTLGPALVDDLERLEDVAVRDRPVPSAEPPPAGDRNPAVTDPGDPGISTYESDVETVSSAAVEDFVHAEVNERRTARGLEPLEWDGTVASVARAHSYDMARRGYFGHANPDGEDPFDRFSAVDDYCRGYGENIALTWLDRPVDRPGGDGVATYHTAEDLADGLVDQWMNSTEHREAILDEHGGPAWDRGGVGVHVADDGAVYAAHNFCHEW